MDVRVSRCIVARYDGRAFLGLEMRNLCDSCSTALPEGLHHTRLKVRRRMPAERGLVCVLCGVVGTYDARRR